MRLPLAALTALATLALAASAAAAPVMDAISTTRKTVGPTNGAQPGPASIVPTGGYYISPILPAGLTATACAKGGGTVLHKATGDVCQSKAPINAATKAPAKKEEAKKE
jgi:hypothetical protein